jgi:hypothetical protein
MGLDMYLYAEKYISQVDYKNEGDDLRRFPRKEYEDVMLNAGMTHLPSTDFGGALVTKCVGYWRKANGIHGWFVRFSGEPDKCQRIYLGIKDLTKLRDDCVNALANRDQATEPITSTISLNGEGEDVVKAIMNEWENQKMRTNTQVLDDDPLAPTEGFFFGNAVRDEWYYNDLEQTVELINALIACDNGDYRYYYQASW